MGTCQISRLARLKVLYQGWRVERLPEGQGFRASSRLVPGQVLEAATVEYLEVQLLEATPRTGPR